MFPVITGNFWLTFGSQSIQGYQAVAQQSPESILFHVILCCHISFGCQSYSGIPSDIELLWGSTRGKSSLSLKYHPGLMIVGYEIAAVEYHHSYCPSIDFPTILNVLWQESVGHPQPSSLPPTSATTL
jgi:hypothetical protein